MFIASDTANSAAATGAAGEAPATSIADEIAAHNKAVETELDAPPVDEAKADEPVVDPVPADTDKASEGDETKADDAEKETKPEEIADTDKASTDDEAVPTVVFDDADTPEAISEKKKAIIDSFPALDKEAPELKALFDHQEAEIKTLREAAGTLAGLPNKETVVELGSAVRGLYEGAEIDPATGVMNVNAAPLIKVLQTKLANEFRPIAEAIFATDSTKYQGATLMEELLVDTFGHEKATRMVAYGQADQPLPTIPVALQLPAGIDDKNKEAFFSLKETKRFEIQGLVDDVVRLEEEMSTASDYYKETIATTLREKREKLDDEIYAVDSIQKRYDMERFSKATSERQNIEAAQQFNAQVETVYNAELATMAEAFAQDLAPRLTYADADTQLSQARNVLSRVNNALSFIINPDGRLTDDPMALFYEKQLTEEGLKADFAGARELLKKHYNVTRTLEALKIRKASPQALEVWEGKRSDIMFELKGQQKALLGQLSAKYVKSNGKALGKQIDAIRDKKQISRTITRGKAAADKQARPVKDEISDYNRRRDQEIRTGDDLYEANRA